MNSGLRQFLIEALRDWHDRLGEIEVYHYEESEFVDHPAAKDHLMREMRETRSKLERMGGDTV